MSTSASLSIRPATLEDVAAVAPLLDAYRQFYEQAPDLDWATRFLTERLAQGESVVLLAEHAEQGLLGFCQLYPSFCTVLLAPIYTLYDLFVLPTARKTGTGTALLQAAEALGHREGRARLDLTTAKTNTTAQALYAAQGWVRDDVFLTYNRTLTGA
ncbi:MAG: N-acetyltransferase [Rhodoferax sp.]|nr:N-acetyltransferase [Rhodoferax sp.]